MAIIQQREVVLLHIYRCPVCKGVYQAMGIPLSCTVNHAPGTCCHYMESTVPAAKLEAVIKVLEEA